MKRVQFAAASAAILLAVAGCGININDLVPTTTFTIAGPNNTTYVIGTCGPTAIDAYAGVPNQIQSAANNLPPEVAGDTVVQAVLQHARYVSTQSLKAANSMLARQNMKVAALPDVSRPVINLAAPHFHNFATMVTDKALRHGAAVSTSPTDQPAAAQFWSQLVTYYWQYYRGNFTPYMGTTFSAPALTSPTSSTSQTGAAPAGAAPKATAPAATTTTGYSVGDAEISNAVEVFVEFLLDKTFQSPIWSASITQPGGKPSTTEYFPSGSATQPTSVGAGTITVQAGLPTGLKGCGMNVPKANFVRSLANAFADAANTESSLAIKTAGGIDIGLGILGKVSIGDNNTLTTLTQMAVSEVISRLTVTIAVPIVSAVDVCQLSSTCTVTKPKAQALVATRTSDRVAATTLAQLFTSSKGQ